MEERRAELVPYLERTYRDRDGMEVSRDALGVQGKGDVLLLDSQPKTGAQAWKLSRSGKVSGVELA
jgi:hypothetical protein